MGQLIASIVLILSYFGVISIGCILAGITAFFDGSPLWFAIAGMLLGVIGLINTHYHLSVAISVFHHMKQLETENKNDQRQ